MPTTATPEQISSATPRVSGALAGSPSTNASIRDVPTMAVTICPTNRMPTVTAINLRDMTLLHGGLDDHRTKYERYRT
jgi:hypothetical protein